MGKLWNFLCNVAAVIYFLDVMLWVLLMLIILPIMLVYEISMTCNIGFSTSNMGLIFIGVLGLLIGVSLLVPAFRRMYYKLPWMFSCVKILFPNVVIMSIASMLLNYGYEVKNSTRHAVFFILMIWQIVICRAIMCIYFSKKKVQYIGVNTNEQ